MHRVRPGCHYVGGVFEQANRARVSPEDGRFAAQIRDRVAGVERLIESQLSSGTDLMSDALGTLVLAGEQRFRPLFTVLAASMGARPEEPDVATAAAVIEMVHLATLHHEDVLDEDEVRRSSHGRTARWNNNLAILAGDFLFATASRLVSRLGPDAVLVIAETFARLIDGQMRETRGAAPGIDEIEHHLAVAYDKRACLLATAGQLGATYSGACPDQIDRLAQLGGTLGMILHISDHIRAFTDTRSDPRNIRALRKGMHTLPLLYALREENHDAQRLRRLLSEPGADDERLDEVVRLVQSSSGPWKAGQTLRKYVDQAAAELSLLPDCEGRYALVAWVSERTNVVGADDFQLRMDR